MTKQSSSRTSWQKVGKWYNDVVGEHGHYYHQTLILPNVLKLLKFSKNEKYSLLDLACGQGVLSRSIPENVSYVGIDASQDLIKNAKGYAYSDRIQFVQADVTAKLPLQSKNFTHATLILALQNIEHPDALFKNVTQHLVQGAPFIIVLNHPCFRIPRQSSWGVDAEQKIQYRRINQYMSSLKIPIQAHPGKGSKSAQTWSFHHPLSSYTLWLSQAGFAIDRIEEWCSNKTSEGSAAKMENRSREEIPLFMTIVARKI
ncbi:MAG: class I SAM-dependent methyltransferase [Parachlamydiaceae bacterium]|nr:class I SAM-dependent methyltransferase [Parachlamydiaceae bacterium]